MLIEALRPLTVRLRTREIRLLPGQPVQFSPEAGRKLLECVPSKVRQTGPEPPLSIGWLVTYRDQDGRLRGGWDEPDAGTVKECHWQDATWTIHLTNGDIVPLSRILAVSQTNHNGAVVAAWTVRAHGYDGEGAGL